MVMYYIAQVFKEQQPPEGRQHGGPASPQMGKLRNYPPGSLLAALALQQQK